MRKKRMSGTNTSFHTVRPRFSLDTTMLTLSDYLPSQNAWKLRLLLNHLGRPYHTVPISIFEGEGQLAEFRRINPTGTVPAIQLEDGRVLAESNAILAYLAEGTPYLPTDPFDCAKVQQWLHFEQGWVESSIGALRHWTMTGKLAQRSPELIEAKRNAAGRSLGILEIELSTRAFLASAHYTIADMAVFAYASRAEEAGLSLRPYPHFRDWIARIESQPNFLATMYPYSIDPHSSRELS